MTVDRSTINGNSAWRDDGGGIASRGPLKVNDFLIFDNSAAHQGGGVLGVEDVDINRSTILANHVASGDEDEGFAEDSPSTERSPSATRR